MKKLSSIFLALILVSSLSASVFAYTLENVDVEVVSETTVNIPENLDIVNFTDIDESNSAYNAFDYLINRGVVKGTSLSTLSPDSAMTRASFVTMLCRNFGGDFTYISESPYFEDVMPMAYYAPSVEWARTEKVTKGITETLFGSNMLITKEQLVTMLYNYVQNHEISLKSVEIMDENVFDMNLVSDWAFNAVVWGNLNSILVKDDLNNFNPQMAATRSDMAIMLYNLDMLITE